MSDKAETATNRVAVIRSAIRTAAWMILIGAAALPGCSQSTLDLQTFFRQDIGLSEDQIAAIRSGQAVAKALPSRTPAEVFLFGAIYIHAAPESYFQFARDFDRRRELPAYWALGVFGNPPQLSDLKDFSFDNDEIQALKKCTPGDCQIQMPASSIEEFHRSINWSAADVNEQVNRLLQKTALQRLLAYQREGNQALGVYNDKHDPTVVPEQFAYMLSLRQGLTSSSAGFLHVPSQLSQRKAAERRRHVLLGKSEVRIETDAACRANGDHARGPRRSGSLCHRRKAALFEPLLRDRDGPLFLRSREGPREARVLSDHGHGF